MKRLLPLLLGLAVSVAQADSNSDYRAGSDFARQIQGQGTGSIQGFKPQESIPGYNAKPGRYSGGQWTLDGSGRSMATGCRCCAPDRLAAVCPKKG